MARSQPATASSSRIMRTGEHAAVALCACGMQAGLQRDGAVEGGQRLVEPPQFGQCEGAVAVDLRLVRPQPQRPAIGFQRLVEAGGVRRASWRG